MAYPPQNFESSLSAKITQTSKKKKYFSTLTDAGARTRDVRDTWFVASCRTFNFLSGGETHNVMLAGMWSRRPIPRTASFSSERFRTLDFVPRKTTKVNSVYLRQCSTYFHVVCCVVFIRILSVYLRNMTGLLAGAARYQPAQCRAQLHLENTAASEQNWSCGAR